MKRLDRRLQAARVRRVLPYLRPGDRIMDVGCADGALFRATASLPPGASVGLDPDLEARAEAAGFPLLPSPFPDGVPDGHMFDAIVMLAVLEHVPPPEQARWAEACARLLGPGGRLLITVPSPAVDRILDALMALRLIDGMEVGQHYGFDPRVVPGIFDGPGLRKVAHRRFQLGLNHLFAFERVGSD
jgi:2-polyprenyl-3-methyl-5-hydroxy-6-metoxy-1,4-benzoquinol methylase